MGDLFQMSPRTVTVITLWQPWASLYFVPGFKDHETRSFRYPSRLHGERIAIHAAAALPSMRHISSELADLCYDAFGCAWNYSLPRGAILGTVELAGCCPVEALTPTEEDRIAGDWTSGRFAWAGRDKRLLAAPLPAKGKQGWWKVDAAALKARARATPTQPTNDIEEVPQP